MLFSILIAHYNNWEYFQECYQSINDQTYQTLEIVIVDDCSTDDSYQKLVDLSQKDQRIKLYQNTENKKVGYTKRRCVEEANGEICGFLDPDDLLSSTALDEVINTYQLDTNCIATYSKIKLIDKNSKEIGDFKLTKKVKKYPQIFFNINFEVAHFFTFKKDAYNKTEGINASLIISEDQDLYLKLYELGNFHFINSFQYYYRIHENGISQNKSKSEQQKADWHKVLLDACNRRGITKLYDKDVNSIENLPQFIFKNENTFFKKIIRKLSENYHDYNNYQIL